jgi:hypothetical protein
MAMSISPAQMMLPVASAASAAPAGRSTQAAVSAATPGAEATAESPSPAPAISPPAQFSTDLEVDDKHQPYYKVVDDSTGDVLFEIPPEALREIGESLNVPLIGDARVPSVDVKS